MGDEKLLADNMVDIIRGIVREEINKTDSTILCQVKNIRSDNSADMIPVSDRSLILKNIPNMTKFSLSVGDYVYLYKINNQLDNSFVCYVLGKNILEGDYSITKDPYSYAADISKVVAAFTPVLTLTGTDLYLQNYSNLAAILEAGQVNLDDVTVGIVIKQHSRSHARHLTMNKDGDRVPMPTLEGTYKNKATSWGGMFVDLDGYYNFSLDSSGKIVIESSVLVAATDFANKHLRVHSGQTAAWTGVKYAFMGAKFKINGIETQCSSNSLAFTGLTGDGTSYLSSGWGP